MVVVVMATIEAIAHYPYHLVLLTAAGGDGAHTSPFDVRLIDSLQWWSFYSPPNPHDQLTNRLLR